LSGDTRLKDVEIFFSIFRGNLVNNYWRVTCILLTCGLTGCGLVGGASPATDTGREFPAPQSIELYLSRANLTETDFEQYRISSGKIFRECGQIRRGRFSPQDQNLENIDSETLARLNEEGSALMGYLSESEPKFDQPGKNASLFDPGQLYLTLRFSDATKEIKTSLDSVTSSNAIAQTRIAKLADLIRHAAKNDPCGNRSFYGLGAKSADH
jgi:hypothetical protein